MVAGLGGTVVVRVVWVGPSVLGGLVVAAGLLGGVWWSGLREKKGLGTGGCSWGFRSMKFCLGRIGFFFFFFFFQF